MSGVEDDEEEDDDAGSDMGSMDNGTCPRRTVKGMRKRQPSRTLHRARKQLTQWHRHSSEEGEEDSDEEMGESHCKSYVYIYQYTLSCVISLSLQTWISSVT